MTHRGKTVGVIRVYTGHPHRFSEFECALLRSVGSYVAAAILNHRLYQNRLVAERYQRQIQQAGAIQRRMIPELSRRHRDLSFGCIYSPTLEVGGDFFDFIDLPRGNLGFCIADVVGKGISAALMMASARAALRAHAHSIYHLDDIMSLVNRHMCRDGRIGEFVTLFYGVFSPDGKRLTYCNAGHEPGLLFRGDELIELETGGMVVGVRPETRYERGLVDLHKGDILVLNTDGVTDAWDFDERRFGRDRLIESLRSHRDLDAVNLAKQVLWDVRRFVGLADQIDDITLVVGKVG
jgi:sigma-B regulation protein RsbU (phosphoserine phosphatase)